MRLLVLGATLLFVLSARLEAGDLSIVFEPENRQLSVQADNILPAELLERITRETGIEIVAPPLGNTPVTMGFSGRNLANGLWLIARNLGYNHVLYFSCNAAGCDTPQRLVLVTTTNDPSHSVSRSASASPTVQKSTEIEADEAVVTAVVKQASTTSIINQRERRNQRAQKRAEHLLAQAERFKNQPVLYQQKLEQIKRKFPESPGQLNPVKGQIEMAQPSTLN